MSGEMTTVISYLEAIEQTTWDLAHKKVEFASAKTQLNTLAAMCQQFEENFPHQQRVAYHYITGLEQNLIKAEAWVKTLENQLSELRLEHAKYRGRNIMLRLVTKVKIIPDKFFFRKLHKMLKNPTRKNGN